MSCILYGLPANGETLTTEHIFAYAIGGRISLLNATYKKCNGKASEEFEAQFSNSFALFRILLGIEGRTGKFPELETTLQIDGIRHKGKIQGGGKIDIPPLGLAAPDICMTFDKEQRQRVVSDLERKNIRFNEVGNSREAEIKGEIFIPFDFIGTGCGMRTAAKAAYTAKKGAKMG